MHFLLLLVLLVLITQPISAWAQSWPQSPPNNGNQAGNNALTNFFNNQAVNGSNASSYANSLNNTPYSNPGLVPKFTPDFWTRLLNRQQIIAAGTILNGTLEDDLSSKNSRIGDTFSILLTDGYSANNQQLIPPLAKVVGVVTAASPVSAKNTTSPGSLQASIQTLALPDGRTVPIMASIVYNPDQANKIDVKKNRGIPVGEYAQQFEYSVYNFAGSATRMFGFPFGYKNQTTSREKS